ncbi:MAG TPA: RraA family protein, partial [Chloroflexota bacterium]
MGFPVFAAGMSPADSKGRCEVVAIREPVEIGGVLVRDGDLVMADMDGCVAVPREIEDEVIAKGLEKVSAENRVRDLLARGDSIRQVFKEYGVL